MMIKADKFKSLIAVDEDGEIVRVRNSVMRKRMNLKEQRRLSRRSICIVCNYAFLDPKTPYSERIKVVAHPFRDRSMIPQRIRAELFSESDFCDGNWIAARPITEKKYDFVVFTLGNKQGIKTKGYHTIPLLVEVANEMKMKGLVVDYFDLGSGGRPRDTDYEGAERGSDRWSLKKTRKRLGRLKNKYVTFQEGAMYGKELNKIHQSARFAIFPNNRDASPRMIAESLIRGMPILVNQNIWGGWKYVNDVNGMFYDSPDTLLQLDEKKDEYKEKLRASLTAMRDRSFDADAIRANYYSQYGFFNSAKRLAGIINDLNGTKYRYCFYAEFKNLLRKWESHEG